MMDNPDTIRPLILGSRSNSHPPRDRLTSTTNKRRRSQNRHKRPLSDRKIR